MAARSRAAHGPTAPVAKSKQENASSQKRSESFLMTFKRNKPDAYRTLLQSCAKQSCLVFVQSSDENTVSADSRRSSTVTFSPWLVISYVHQEYASIIAKFSARAACLKPSTFLYESFVAALKLRYGVKCVWFLNQPTPQQEMACALAGVAFKVYNMKDYTRPMEVQDAYVQCKALQLRPDGDISMEMKTDAGASGVPGVDAAEGVLHGQGLLQPAEPLPNVLWFNFTKEQLTAKSGLDAPITDMWDTARGQRNPLSIVWDPPDHDVSAGFDELVVTVYNRLKRFSRRLKDNYNVRLIDSNAGSEIGKLYVTVQN